MSTKMNSNYKEIGFIRMNQRRIITQDNYEQSSDSFSSFQLDKEQQHDDSSSEEFSLYENQINRQKKNKNLKTEQFENKQQSCSPTFQANQKLKRHYLDQKKTKVKTEGSEPFSSLYLNKDRQSTQSKYLKKKVSENSELCKKINQIIPQVKKDVSPTFFNEGLKMDFQYSFENQQNQINQSQSHKHKNFKKSSSKIKDNFHFQEEFLKKQKRKLKEKNQQSCRQDQENMIKQNLKAKNKSARRKFIESVALNSSSSEQITPEYEFHDFKKKRTVVVKFKEKKEMNHLKNFRDNQIYTTKGGLYFDIDINGFYDGPKKKFSKVQSLPKKKFNQKEEILKRRQKVKNYDKLVRKKLFRNY